ncbi:hypothetical protein ARMGADRAFT_1085231 [Armillaria gallica]|uniref:Uncharacterized protein n=1 Tax=Armillaria gallica TaxID=47427 RepID=A0A2H3D2C2_ARMGA|nr:hypothetical protein ARMGADRAFT_1085231 [Armillaria gallica]
MPIAPLEWTLDLSLASQANLIKQLKTIKMFSKESVIDLDNFTLAPTLEECYTFMFAATLETRDMLKELVKIKAAEEYEMKDNVKKLITLHAKGFVYLLTATSYVGLDIPKNILLTMQANNMTGLPNKQDIIGKNKIIKEINSALSDAHHCMKSKLLETLSATTNANTQSIGAVTEKILGNSGVPMMLQLQMHISVMCWHLIHFLKLNPKKFWPHVNNFFAQALEKGKENYHTCMVFSAICPDILIDPSACAVSVLNSTYHLNIAAFGDPDLTKYPVLDLVKDSDKVLAWIVTNNTFFNKIRPQVLPAEERVAPTLSLESGTGKHKQTENDIGGEYDSEG